MIQNRSLGSLSIHFTTHLFPDPYQKQNSDKTPESVSEDVSPALLLEVLLALGLLVVVPKSLLVVVPFLASVGDMISWEMRNEMNHPVRGFNLQRFTQQM